MITLSSCSVKVLETSNLFLENLNLWRVTWELFRSCSRRLPQMVWVIPTLIQAKAKSTVLLSLSAVL